MPWITLNFWAIWWAWRSVLAVARDEACQGSNWDAELCGSAAASVHETSKFAGSRQCAFPVSIVGPGFYLKAKAGAVVALKKDKNITNGMDTYDILRLSGMDGSDVFFWHIEWPDHLHLPLSKDQHNLAVVLQCCQTGPWETSTVPSLAGMDCSGLG